MQDTPRQNADRHTPDNPERRARFVQFNIRMTPAEAEETRQLAKASGFSISQLVRTALRFFKENRPF